MAIDFSWHVLTALTQVILIDVTLAGDNAIVIGMAVRGLEAKQQRVAILIGTIMAAVLRIGLAMLASRLLSVVGLTLAGGLLLAWVCWKMYEELREHGETSGPVAATTLWKSIFRLTLADLSMSLDNVLAVAGASIGHPYVLMSGLAISVLLMGVAASFVARLLERYRWIAWVGLAVVAFVAVRLIASGGHEVWHHVGI